MVDNSRKQKYDKIKTLTKKYRSTMAKAGMERRDITKAKEMAYKNETKITKHKLKKR